MYKIAVLEDNPAEAEKTKNALRRYASERNLLFSLRFYSDGKSFLEEYEADLDLVFLDIEMPGMDGMETARRLREKDENVCLIFMTKLIHYAIEGYSVRALDFVVKPASYEALSIKLDRALQLIDRRRSRRIAIQTGESIQWLNAEEIRYVEVMNHTLFYHLKDGKLNAYGTIKDCEQKLAPQGFARCSNSYLVNLRHVTQVRGNDVRVGQAWLPIGRTKRKEFMQRLAEYAGDSAL